MSKLGEYIEQARNQISLIEEQKGKGYEEFFKQISVLTYKSNPNRNALTEYIIANVASFFEKMGVDYSDDINTEYYSKLSGENVPFDTIVSGIKGASKLLEDLANASDIYLQDEYMLEFPALLYAIETIPDMRKVIVETFGKNLISDDIFIDVGKIERELEQVIEISKTILEGRNISALSDEEVVETTINKNQRIIDLNREIENIEAKLAIIRKSIEENGIYTLDNHPTYKKLTEELRSKIDAKEEIIKRINESDPRVLRENLMPSQEYETEYARVKKAQEIERELENEGKTPRKAIEELELETRAKKSELAGLTSQKRVLEWHTKQLEALDALIQSEEYDKFHSLYVELESCVKKRSESATEFSKVKAVKEKIIAAKKKFDELGFIAKKGEEGKKLKTIIDSEAETETSLISSEKAYHTALQQEQEITDEYNLAFSFYNQLFCRLNENDILSHVLAISDASDLKRLTRQEIEMIRDNVAATLQQEQERFNFNYRTGEEELQNSIRANEGKVEELTEVIDYQATREKAGDLFYESLIKAVELISEDSTESSVEESNSHRHK